LSCHNEVQDIYDAILTKLYSVISMYVLFKTAKSKPALPVHIRTLLKEKKKVYQSRTLSSIHMNTYKKFSMDYNKAVSDWHDKIEDNIFTTSNPA